MERFHLSATEREVMEKIWGHGEPIRQTKLLEEFRQEGKSWARQTLNTVLQRLEAKGLVVREKRIVRAKLTPEQFGLEIAMDAIKIYYDGGVGQFFAAFADVLDDPEEDKQLLRDYIRRREQRTKGK